MTEIITGIIVVSILAAITNALIPDGGIKAAAEKLISFAAISAILSSIFIPIINKL